MAETEVVEVRGKEYPAQVVEQAQAQGWDPDYDGEHFTPPDEFLERGKQINGILRKQNARLETELAAVKAAAAAQEADVTLIKQDFAKMREQAYDRAISEVRAELRAAKKEEDNDETIETLEERLDALKAEKAEKPAAATKPTPPNNQAMIIFNEWVQENDWFAKDEDLRDNAEVIAIKLRRDRPDLVGRPYLDEMKSRLKAKFPTKFGSPAGDREGPGDGGIPAGGITRRGTKKGPKGWDDLPADVKAQGERFIKQKISTKESFSKNYWESEGE
jgi:hypothetical protein